MNKLNKLGYTKIEVLVIVVLLGVVAFITINKTSYAFAMDNKDAVNDVINLIEFQAEEYGIDNLAMFDESDTIFINVNDLVEKGYLIANEKGLITNPADINKNFNENKVKIEYNKEENKTKATFVE